MRILLIESKTMHGLICGTDFIKVRGRKNIEIAAYVKNGLQPYDELEIPILPPEVAGLISLIRELGYDIECMEIDFPEFKNGNIANSDINFSEKIYYWKGSNAEIKEDYDLKKIQLEHSEKKLKKYYELPSWKGYQLPVKLEDRKSVINELLNALYKWEDIFELEKKFRIEDYITDKVVLNQENPRQEVIENAFFRRGKRPDETWQVWFKGKALNPILGADGMVYIANLLSKPGQQIHVTDLCNSVNLTINGAMIEDYDLTDSLHEGSMSISKMQDDGIDDEGKQNLRKKLFELKETINDKDLPEDERVNANVEYEKIMKTINTVYGKKPLVHHAPRKVNESVKKDMDRAKKAIKRACEKIQEQSPSLSEYLKLNIKTGTIYIFIDKDTSWQISF